MIRNTIAGFSPSMSRAVDVSTIGNGITEAKTQLRKRPTNPYFTKKGFSRTVFKKSVYIIKI
ncbi:MAG: hypothetical protein KGI11_00280 [Thaumarchaeota archaeon]|nr:hypothetical protein [Nitrososphaerota archaeon]